MDRNAPFAAFGRILIAALFIISGIGKVAEPVATQASIVAAGLPWPLLALSVSIAVEIGGGVLLIVGYRTQIVALILALFAITTALVFHRVHGDVNQQVNFLKNFAIAGGLLQLAAFGAGRLSLDAKSSGAANYAAKDVLLLSQGSVSRNVWRHPHQRDLIAIRRLASTSSTTRVPFVTDGGGVQQATRQSLS